MKLQFISPKNKTFDVEFKNAFSRKSEIKPGKNSNQKKTKKKS